MDTILDLGDTLYCELESTAGHGYLAIDDIPDTVYDMNISVKESLYDTLQRSISEQPFYALQTIFSTSALDKCVLSQLVIRN